MSEHDKLLSRGGISLERLATLCRVVEEGGLSKAAGGDVSRLSLYSRQVKDLEAFFGVALGRKVGRVVVPNDAARAIASAARAQFKALQSLVGVPSAIADFTFGASHSLLEWHIMPRLGRLADAVGDRRRIRLLSMRSRDLVAAVDDHRVDLALVRSDAVPRGLKSREVLRLGYSLFVPLSLAGRRSPRQVLEEVPLAVAHGGNLRDQVDVAARREGFSLRISLECTSFTLTANAVRTNQYAAILPEIAAASLNASEVIRLPLPFRVEPSRVIAAIWQRGVAEKLALAAVRALQTA